MATMSLGSIAGVRDKLVIFQQDMEGFQDDFLRAMLKEGNAHVMAKLKTHFDMPPTTYDHKLVHLIEMWAAARAIEAKKGDVDGSDAMRSVITWKEGINLDLEHAKLASSDPKALDLGLTAKAAPSASSALVRTSETDKAAWSDLCDETGWREKKSGMDGDSENELEDESVWN